MREKDAVENEYKHLARTNEKLIKYTNNLKAIDKETTNRLVSSDMDMGRAVTHLTGRA